MLTLESDIGRKQAESGHSDSSSAGNFRTRQVCRSSGLCSSCQCSSFVELVHLGYITIKPQDTTTTNKLQTARAVQSPTSMDCPDVCRHWKVATLPRIGVAVARQGENI